jgi:hypothetical protein
MKYLKPELAQTAKIGIAVNILFEKRIYIQKKQTVMRKLINISPVVVLLFWDLSSCQQGYARK